ncbi:MAG: hypothetical protein KC445_13305 [Anaerolineales bacterium]|nr:hypothetical protein [Anaerolineales bacterium]
MIRSRLLLIILFVAYLGVTPAGVYTCACLYTTHSDVQQVDVGEFSGRASVADTAVTSLLSYISLSFLTAVVFVLSVRYGCCKMDPPPWRKPNLFSEPPPTPSPHFI